MTNKEIRKKAWELSKANFWRLLGVTLFIALITVPFILPYAAVFMSTTDGSMPGAGASLTASVSIFLMMIVAPILEAGLLQYLSNLWNGQAAGIRTLFTHARRVLRLIGIGLLTVLCMYAVMIPGMLLLMLLGSFVPFLAFIVGILWVIAIVFVMFRISPAMTAFILDPDRKAVQCIGTAWRATKGNVRRMFSHSFMLILPYFAASLLIALLTPVTGAYASAIANTIVSVATMLFSALFSIYAQIGMYGLNEQLLTTLHADSNVSAAELWNAAPILPADDDDEYEDEYEDIPEEELDNEENPGNDTESN